MSCAALQLDTAQKPLFAIRKVRNEAAEADYISWVYTWYQVCHFPLCKVRRYGLVRGVSPWSLHHLGISARHKLGFATRDAHLQHRNLRPRLYFYWCLSQFWGHKEKSKNSSVIYFLTCFSIALLLRSLWPIRVTTLELAVFRWISPPLSFWQMLHIRWCHMALWSLATREATQ